MASFTLRPMSEDKFVSWLPSLRSGYADEMVRHGGVDPATAGATAARETEQLFPGGKSTLWGAKIRCPPEKSAICRQDANFGTPTPTRAGWRRRTANPCPRRFDDAICSADSSTNMKRPPREIE